MSLTPGEVINNRYRIVKLLGTGGYGAVYRAWDLNLQKSCAVKENLDFTDELQSQFMREAMTLANLAHPILPRVIDHFSIQGRGQYMVMDFVEGENLESMVVRQGPIVVERAVQWVGQIAEALEYLHHQNPPLIHRDIKPANIIITPSNQAMLVDFGLVKIFQPFSKTAKGARGVTPGFSPVEQYGSGKTDARTDIYALGATLYALLTGRVPPQSVDIMAGAEQPPPPAHILNPKVPPGLSQALQRAMQMDPSKRYQSAAEFRLALFTAVPSAARWSDAPTHIPYGMMPTAQSPGATVVAPEAIPAPSGGIAVQPSSRPAGRKGLALAGGLGGCVILVILLILAGGTLYGLYAYTDVLSFLYTPTPSPTPTFTPTVTPTPTPSPTFTLIPTPTPTFTPSPSPTPLSLTPVPVFFDTFSDPSTGWDQQQFSDAMTDYQNGVYRIWVNVANTDVWANPGLNYYDVIVEVDAYKAGGSNDNDFGVICRYQNNMSFYVAVVSSDGYAGILMRNGGNLSVLGDEYLRPYDAIYQGAATNHIRFDCVGPDLILYVNGTFVTSQQDYTFSYGDVGLLAGTYSEPGTDIYFDNFTVYLP